MYMKINGDAGKGAYEINVGIFNLHIHGLVDRMDGLNPSCG
jgi:hypothetical protein